MGKSNTIDQNIVYIVLGILLFTIIIICAKYFRRTGLGSSKIIAKFNRKEIYSLIVILAIIVIVNLALYLSNYDSPFASLMEGSPLKNNILKHSFKSTEVTAYYYPPSKSLDGFSEEQPECLDIEYKRILSSSDPFKIQADMKNIRNEARRLAESEYEIAKYCFLDKESESENSIIKHKWFNFCGSSVWLPKYNVYFYVSRVVYSESKHRNRPTISLVYAQIFDRKWNEVLDFKFKRADKTLTFPRFMQIKIHKNPKGKNEVMGPEDPRILVRRFTNEEGEPDEEPIIIFNMRSTDIKWYRAIHMFRPFYDDKTIRFSINNQEPRWREKNWAPFFDGSDDKINFVYSFAPLIILKCELNDGKCDKDGRVDLINSKRTGDIGVLRGGTNLIPIPNDVLPKELKDKKYWFGIARSHIKDCGCLNEIYRPHAFVLSKDESNFKIEYISSFVDFSVNVEPWTISQSTCADGKSVLIPNSITNWDFMYDNNNLVGDIMTITFSEADRTNKIIFVQGFLEQLLVALNKVNEQGSEINMIHDNSFVGFLVRCSTSLSNSYCKNMEEIQNWSKVDF